MFISVIICTYGRATALGDLLNSLNAQTYWNFETLIIDGNSDPSPAQTAVQAARRRPGARITVDLIPCEKGLTRQRNAALRLAEGDVLCFLDDDVTIEPTFLAQIAEVFERPEMHRLGGLTAYDALNFPAPVTLRWRLRRALGVVPRLEPGGVDEIGRALPLSFLKPFSGFKEIGWLSGFCMAYRRAAVSDIWFDELVSTYGGEDRDFSMQVGKSWLLLICGDLRIRHHSAPQGRDSDLDRNAQCSFGAGRRFAKSPRSFRNSVTMARAVFADFVIDAIFFISKPTRLNFSTMFVKLKSFFAGFRSSVATPPAASRREVEALEQKPEHVSSTP